MTELLYQTDSYLKEFEAIVTSIDGENRAIALDRSCFYPGGGGQPADSGKFFSSTCEFIVRRAKKIGEEVFHYVEGDDPLPAKGEKVRAVVDWERRYQLMRTHTALHILCGVVFRDYGASVTGGDMDPLQGRMDFEFETMHIELVNKIEKSVNEEVRLSRQIRVAILPTRSSFSDP